MADDLAYFFDDDTFAEEVSVASLLVRGIFSIADEIVVEDVVVQAPTLRVRSSIAASVGDVCKIRGTSYKVRQVLDMPPDGVIRRLVLAAV